MLLSALWLLTLGSAAGTPPQDVRFSSHNLRNFLEWTPGPGATNETRYTVEYAIYGDEEHGGPGQLVWRPKRQCRRVSKTWCNLSNETSDLEEKYYARVRATGLDGVSEWSQSEQFDPRLDTTFGPPAVTLLLWDRHLAVSLSGPLRWRSRSGQREKPMSKYYPHMLYSLSFCNNKTGRTWSVVVQNNSMEFPLLDFGTTYCISARAHFASNLYKTLESEQHCASTAKDPILGQVMWMLLGGLVPTAVVLFLLVLVGFLMYHYVYGNKQSQPTNLLVPHLNDDQHKFFSDVLLTVNFINIAKPETDLGVRRLETSDRPEDEEQPLVTPPLAVRQVPRGDVRTEGAEEGGEPDDYGVVVEEHKNNNDGAKRPYIQQQHTTCTQDHRKAEEEEGIIVNWDPQTRMLQIPLIPKMELNPDPAEVRTEEEPTRGRDEELLMLSGVYIRQTSSQASGTFEDDLTKMENFWSLRVNMGS